MKRFHWPLQIVLDVKVQRELAQRAELLRTTRQIATVHQEIIRRKRMILTSLEELNRQELAERISQQEVVMACSASRQRQIDRLRRELAELEDRRKSMTARLIRTKRSREVLEKMRGEAMQVHVREQLRLEQKELDERAHLSFARVLGERQTAGGPAGG